MLDHVSIQCANVAASAAFYDTVLSPLGAERLMEVGSAIGYGVAGHASFWLSPLAGDRPNRELHIAFRAADRSTVRAFFEAGGNMGAEVLHEPRLWPEYDPDYYGAFLRDPDGNNVEAVCRVPE